MAFLRSGSAYLVQNQIVLQGTSITPIGRQLYGPVFTVDIFDPAIVGHFITEILNESRENIPPTDAWPLNPNPEKPMLKAAKVRSWTAFYRISKNVGVLEKEGCIAFTPTKRVSQRASIYLEDKTLTSDLDPENMGKALLQAFELCE